MTPYYATINQDGDTIEVFENDNRHEVKPQQDYHQIIRLDPSRPGNPITHRYTSLYDLLNIPF